MKVVDDKLRIIDDVPSSAVELSVKEKVNINFDQVEMIVLMGTYYTYNYILNRTRNHQDIHLQFLKKVQRQERIVEEIKLVLKPYYNRKKINKDDYKDILRKCVPKVRSLMSCLSIESVQKFKNLA